MNLWQREKVFVTFLTKDRNEVGWPREHLMPGLCQRKKVISTLWWRKKMCKLFCSQEKIWTTCLQDIELIKRYQLLVFEETGINFVWKQELVYKTFRWSCFTRKSLKFSRLQSVVLRRWLFVRMGSLFYSVIKLTPFRSLDVVYVEMQPW